MAIPERKQCSPRLLPKRHAISPPSEPELLLAVLAGGASRRMGQDKALMILNGKTLLERVCNEGRKAGLPVLIIGREAGKLPPSISLFESIPDTTPGLGPLGGLACAMKSHSNCDILLCACDLPEITSESFLWLIHAWQKCKNYHAAGLIPVWQGLFEPLFAIYSASLCSTVQQMVFEGRLAMKDLIRDGDFMHINLPPTMAGAIKDVDSPSDLAHET